MAECGKKCFTNVVCIRTAFLMDLGKLNPSTGGKKRGKNVLLFFAFKNCTQLLLPHTHPRFYCGFSHMQLLVGVPTCTEDLLVLLRLLLWSKHEKVPMHFYFKTAPSQWKLLLSLHKTCLYNHGLLNSEYVHTRAGASWAGRAVCTHRRSAIVLELFECCR